MLPKSATFSSLSDLSGSDSIGSLRTRSRSFTSGVMPKEMSKCLVSDNISGSNLSADVCQNVDKDNIKTEQESEKHHHSKEVMSPNTDKSTEKENVCPTQANLPMSKPPSTKAVKKCKKGKRRHNMKRTRKRTHLAKIQISSSPNKVPNRSSNAPRQHFKSISGDDNSSTPNTAHVAHRSRRNEEQLKIHGMLQKKKCHRTYSDDPVIDEKLPMTNGGTATHTMPGGNRIQHGRASTNEDVCVHVHIRVCMPYFVCVQGTCTRAKV